MHAILALACLALTAIAAPHKNKRDVIVIVETETDIVWVTDVQTVTAEPVYITPTSTSVVPPSSTPVLGHHDVQLSSVAPISLPPPPSPTPPAVTYTVVSSPTSTVKTTSSSTSVAQPPVVVVTVTVSPSAPTTTTTSTSSTTTASTPIIVAPPPVVPTSSTVVVPPVVSTSSVVVVPLVYTSSSTAAAAVAVAQVSTTTSASYGHPTTYDQLVIAHHNLHRHNHSAPDMVWDNNLAAAAATIASSCSYAHNTNVDKDIIGGYGQNIAAGVGADNISVIITELFYNGEVNWYNGLYNESNPDMSEFEHWGHFSQIVWKATTKVGCATQHCDVLANVGSNVPPHFTVCNYQSPGNVGGEYGDQIGQSLDMPTAHWNYFS